MGQDPARMECGTLTVPANWDRRSSDDITLRTVVLASTSETPAPDPFVYLAGGPGVASLDSPTGLPIWTAEFAAPIQSRRDLVFIDLRGTGRSQPSLDCPEVDANNFELFGQHLAVEDERESRVAATVACFDRLEEAGVDLTGFTSVQMARDVDVLRELLGYETMNVWGVSYGSRLVQTLLRDRPDSVRSAVLDSVVPVENHNIIENGLSFQRALEALDATCRANPSCVGAFGDLTDRFEDLVAEFDVTPLEIRPIDRRTGQRIAVLFNGARYAGFIQQGLFATDLLPLVPALLAAGRGAAPLIEAGFDPGALSTEAEGVFNTVLCQEKEPFASELRYRLIKRLVRPAYQAFDDLFQFPPLRARCDALDLPRRSRIEDRPVRSDVPTLVLSGQFDPITPPRYGREVARRLSRSYFFQLPFIGHGVIRSRNGEVLPRCSMRIMAAFVEDPHVEPDSSCIATMPRAF
jgi:pimeloyl-ACP methyl ester carboxylesterase